MDEAILYGEDPSLASYYYGNYDARHGNIKIGDELIREARHFDGWHREFRCWDRKHWEEYPHSPSRDPEKNAYHIRRLADAMREAQGWIGCALEVDCGGRGVLSGSHRLRAWRYLITAYDLKYPVPIACHNPGPDCPHPLRPGGPAGHST